MTRRNFILVASFALMMIIDSSTGQQWNGACNADICTCRMDNNTQDGRMDPPDCPSWMGVRKTNSTTLLNSPYEVLADTNCGMSRNCEAYNKDIIFDVEYPVSDIGCGDGNTFYWNIHNGFDRPAIVSYNQYYLPPICPPEPPFALIDPEDPEAGDRSPTSQTSEATESPIFPGGNMFASRATKIITGFIASSAFFMELFLCL